MSLSTNSIRPVLPDLALLGLSTVWSIRGTKSPHFPDRDEADSSGRAKDRILIFTRLEHVLHLGLLALVYLEGKAILADPVEWIREPARRQGYLTGLFASFVASLLRLRCYKELGSFFTFALAVKKKGGKVVQKIVDTGPYSIVRHPSYTAMLLLVLGVAISHIKCSPLMLSSASSPAFLRRLAASSNVIMLAQFLITLSIILLRINDEEEMLGRELGASYRSYRSRVRSKLIPYLL